MKIEAILITHCHFDHIGAVAPVATVIGAPVYCPEIERPLLADIMAYVPMPGIGPYDSYEADETLKGGETLELAGMTIDVIFTPGHSPGHVTYSVRDEEAMFSGDVLFKGSVGRVDLPGGDGPTLIRSIRTLLDTHPAGDGCVSGAHGGHHTRRRARHQPVPRRPGALSARSGPAQVRSRDDGEQVPGPAGDLRRPAGRRPGAAADRIDRRGDLRPRRLRADRHSRIRGHRVVRARCRSLDRRRPQGDVQLRGQGWAQHHPAARGHGADLPRLRRARDAQAGAAGEARLRRALLPP